MMAAALVCFITLVQFQYIANRSVQKDVVAYLDTSEDQTLRKNLGLGPDSIQIDLDGLSAGISPSSTVTSTDDFESVPVLAARAASPSKNNKDASCAPQVYGVAHKILHSSAAQKVFGAVKKTPEKAKSFGYAVSFRTRNAARSLTRSKTSK
ncbi:uncharacterized protein [Bemisia tabaci]|uniref:uncharacterized protein n=1 Tax=Bemisia tabaci TaxID=7038 RepID=UPI003B27D367